MATDQEIRDAGFKYIPQQKYLQNPFEIPTSEEPVVDQGIVATNAFIGGDGGGGYYPGSPNTLVGNYQSIIDARQKRLNNPSSTFLGFNTMRDQQLTGADAGEYIGSGTPIPQEMTMMGKVQNFLTPQSAQEIMKQGYEPQINIGILSNILGKFDKYGSLPTYDQAFIAQNMGYTGPTVFGDNQSGLSKDPFGINTRSAFGNYGEYVTNAVTDLEAALEKARSKYDTEEEFLDMTKLMRTKLDFYRKKQKEREVLRKQEFDKPGGTGEQVAALNQKMQDTGVTGKDYDQAANIAGGGGGNQVINTPAGPMTAREATYDNDPSTGTSQGYSQHYARGGLASIL